MANIQITLTAYNMGPDTTETDFESWVSFARNRLPYYLSEHELDIDSCAFGASQFEDEISATGDLESEVREALSVTWDDWCGGCVTLADFSEKIAGGIFLNDRGNGCAGPMWLGEGVDIDAVTLSASVQYVSEEQDPEAWQLAREAFRALNLVGSPEYVAVGEQSDGDNGHQAIYIG